MSNQLRMNLKKSLEGLKNTKEDLRVQRTKHIRRESIAKLLENKDLKDISIQQISKKAMIYRTTFYSHYTTKYELLEDYLMESWKTELDFKTDVDEKNIYKVYWDGILQTANFFKKYSELFIQLNETISIISKSNLLYVTLKEFFMIWLNLLQPDDSKVRVPKEKICEIGPKVLWQ